MFLHQKEGQITCLNSRHEVFLETSCFLIHERLTVMSILEQDHLISTKLQDLELDNTNLRDTLKATLSASLNNFWNNLFHTPMNLLQLLEYVHQLNDNLFLNDNFCSQVFLFQQSPFIFSFKRFAWAFKEKVFLSHNKPK